MMPLAVSSRNANADGPMTRPPMTQMVPVDGLGFNVERRGAGSPVLLLHEFPDSLPLWRDVAPRLEAAGFEVIAVNQRGFGDSDAPAGRQHYGMDRLITDMTGLLETLGVREPVHVMGHDWGALVTWRMAIQRPDTVRSAVAISVGHPREYTLAGLEQKRKGLYTIGWQFPWLAERWLTARDWARMRHWLRRTPIRSRAFATSRGLDGSRPASTGTAPTWCRLFSGRGARAPCRCSTSRAARTTASPRTRWPAPADVCPHHGATSASKAPATGCRSNSRNAWPTWPPSGSVNAESTEKGTQPFFTK